MLTVHEIIKATGGILLSGNRGRTISGISIDSRSIRSGEIFVAMKGHVFDGHDFIESAL